jgi:hypothetical protein
MQAGITFRSWQPTSSVSASTNIWPLGGSDGQRMD